MMINGWDIAHAGGQQWNVTFGNHTLSNESEWKEGAISPFLMKSELGFKSMTLVILIRGANREEILDNRSRILGRFLEPAELTLDGYFRKFKGVTTKIQSEETVMQRWHKLTLSLSVYEFGEAITYKISQKEEMMFENPGNAATPVRLEINPLAGTDALTITGICRDHAGQDMPVMIASLESGKIIVLDGESGLMTQDGEQKAADVDMWDIPSLTPGVNKITLDSPWMELTAKFYPRYM